MSPRDGGALAVQEPGRERNSIDADTSKSIGCAPSSPAPVSNRAFLQGLLPELRDGEAFWTCALTCDPNSPKAKWWGHAVSEEHGPSELDVHGNYFAVAAIRVPDDGQPQRKKDTFGRLFVLPLDDSEGALPLPPTYVIQTSPGKRQVGYRLRDPIADPKTADRLMQEAVRSGRLDKVDHGGVNAIRYVRLPVGCNAKAKVVEANGGEPFRVQLIEWRPERAYSVEEIAQAFGLDLDFIEGRAQRASEKRRKQARGVGSNNVIAALRAKGLYKAALGDGKHDILCPWAEEHTTGDGGTAYFEPSEENPVGGFKCLHGHCADRHLKDLCAVLGVESPAETDAQGRRIVYERAGTRLDTLEQAVAAIAPTDDVFQRAAMLVKPCLLRECDDDQTEDPKSCAVERKRDKDQLTLVPYNTQRMQNTLAVHVALRAWDGEGWRPKDPPEWVAKGIVEDPAMWRGVRPLVGVTTAPILQPDGTLFSEPGYHARTGLIYRPSGEPITLPKDCTRETAAAALGRFAFFISAYPFAAAGHRSAVLAMALAALARHLFTVTPYLHVDAPKQGSGKSFIGEAIGVLVLGVKPAAFTYPTDPEETRKILTSCMKKGDTIILFDNAEDRRKLDDPALASFITKPKHSDRLLHQNEAVAFRNNVILIGNGNNNLMAGDLPRRTLIARIEPEVERPEERSFSFNPVEWVHAHRGEMTRDGLTILAAYLRAGMPGADKLTPWGNFEDFRLIRGALVWLGLEDPRKATPPLALDDSDVAEAEVFLRIWRYLKDHRKDTFTAHEVEPRMLDLDVLRDANLGAFLSGRRGQVKCGGLIVRDTGRKATGKRTLWRMTGEPSRELLEDDCASRELTLEEILS